MTPERSVGFAVGIVLLTAKCTVSPDGARELPVVSDSSGVIIVENPAPRNTGDPVWTLTDTPHLTIGGTGANPGSELYRVTSGIRLDDGRIVIANAGTAELRFFDSTGQALGSVGGRGGGPGEFQVLDAVRRYGSDSLVAFDSRQGRMTFYDLQGNLSRVSTIMAGGGGNRPFLQGTLGVFDDNTLFMTTLDPFGEESPTGPRRAVERAFRFSADGALLDSLGSFRGLEIYVETSGGGYRTTPRIFGYSTVYASTGSHFFAGSNDRYEISRYTANGLFDMSIRRIHDAVAVGPHHRDLFVQSRTANMSPANRMAFEERFRISQPPETFPAYSGILADREDNLWVRGYLPPDEENVRFSVFDSHGGWITDVDVPDDITVLEIGSDYVLALWTDEMDVEYVRLFGLIKTEQLN